MIKKKFLVGILICFLIVCAFIVGRVFYVDRKSNNTVAQNDSVNVDNLGIADPDRIIFRDENQYYEISQDSVNYEKIVNQIKQSVDVCNSYNISEFDIDDLKRNNSFVEFDYDRISKNNVFFLSGDIGWIKMKDSDGDVYSNELQDGEAIIQLLRESVSDDNKATFDEELYRAQNLYRFLPATNDFEEVKQFKVYKKVLDSYSEYRDIVTRYKINFDQNINIENFFENRKVILFLSKYDISGYKVNIGNIKISFSGLDYVVEDGSQNYIPMLMVVGTVTNTNCIYYNYEQIATMDNLTGTQEHIVGVVKSKNGNKIEVGYTEDDWNLIGIVNINNDTEIKYNQNQNEIKAGDWISMNGLVSSFTGNNKTYNALNINVTSGDEYQRTIGKYIIGKDSIDTSIIYYSESESGYDGYVICPISFNEDSYDTDAYLKIYYDFYGENGTQSYLGMGNHLQANYGIVKNEIVDITFTEKVTDANKIKARMFEYFAD